MKSQPRNLNLNEVVTVAEKDAIFIRHETFKIGELVRKILEHLAVSFPTSKEKIICWMEEGVECELLSPNTSWQKGRIKISLEFIPDEIEPEDSMSNGKVESDVSESPLDDVRQMM